MTAWDKLATRRDGVPVLMPGHVWLAGAGPGDPGVLALASKQARLEFAGRRGGKPSALQADITQRLIALARGGHRVLRLKGGDPFVFGRGGEEAMALAAASIPF